jgi:hypothetical protein
MHRNEASLSRLPKRSRALAHALFLVLLAAACQGEKATGVDCGTVAKGCVDVMNFSSQATNIYRSGDVPSQANLIQPGNPGIGYTTVDSTQGARTTFTASRNGTTIATVECTVGPNSWVSINPAVVLQPDGTQLDCSGWSF